MKVNELIVELQKQDSDAEVVTEGCDYYGDVTSVIKTNLFFTSNGDPVKSVLLCRTVEE